MATDTRLHGIIREEVGHEGAGGSCTAYERVSG